MSSNQPGRRPPSKKNAPPPMSRRSARQERLARRDGRSLQSAGTQAGSGGFGFSPIMIASVGAILVVALMVGFVLLSSNTTTPIEKGYSEPVGTNVTPADLAHGRTLGPDTAKVTLDLWSDFQCPGCQNFAQNIEPKLVDKYVKSGDLKIVWHDFTVVDTIVSGHESQDAANAARCAADQGKFWTFHDWLYVNQYKEGTGDFTKARLIEIGRRAGLDMTKFEPCVNNDTHVAEVKNESATTPTTSTPGIWVAGTRVGTAESPPGYDQIAAAVEVALGHPAPTASPSAAPSATATPSPTSSDSAAPSPSVSASVSAEASPSATASS